MGDARKGEAPPVALTTERGESMVLGEEQTTPRVYASKARMRSKTRRSAEPKDLLAYSLSQLTLARFPERSVILTRGGVPMLRSGQIVQIFGPRGVGKTLFMATIALGIAGAVPALGFASPRRYRVLIIDGEMAREDLQSRFKLLCEVVTVSPDVDLKIIANDWQHDPMSRLDTEAGQEAVETAVENADVIFVDNRSSLFDTLSETDASAWMPAQAWLLSLRRRGKAVVLIHHANRQGGARGHGKSEDIIDLSMKLSRPRGYSFSAGACFRVEWDKARSVSGDALTPFQATLGEGGWEISGDNDPALGHESEAILRFLRSPPSGPLPRTRSELVAAAHVSKPKGLKAVQVLLEAGRIAETEGQWSLAPVPPVPPVPA